MYTSFTLAVELEQCKYLMQYRNKAQERSCKWGRAVERRERKREKEREREREREGGGGSNGCSKGNIVTETNYLS